MTTAAEIRADQEVAQVKARIRAAIAENDHVYEVHLQGVIIGEDAANRLRTQGYVVSRYADGCSVKWK